VVFACSRDKDVEAMLRRLLPATSCVLGTEFATNPRYFPLAELEQMLSRMSPGGGACPGAASEMALGGSVDARQEIDVRCVASPSSEAMPAGAWAVFGTPAMAWEAAVAQAGPDDVVCATGSFFLAAELLSHLGEETSSVTAGQ
jgi:folylpolyglutamate synthase/dihydropteroate synthase